MDNLFLKYIFKENVRVLIFGAGERGRKAADILQDFDIACIGFIDNDKSKQGVFIGGLPVYSAEEGLALKTEEDILLVSMLNSDKLYEDLKESYANVYPTEYADLLMRFTYLECEKYGYHRIEEMVQFGSPYPDLSELQGKKETKAAKEIDFNMAKQEEIYNDMLELYQTVDRKAAADSKRRYYEDNTTYGVADALLLYGMIRRAQPENIIEIGSGLSSAVMLDVNEYIFDNKIRLHFIEPYPQRLKKILKDTDHIRLEEKNLQEIEPDLFDELTEGDILFVDSSHMVKRGSDVNKIVFEILPRLKPGVYIHFHDIMMDFEYPVEWLSNGWVWNESYLIRAFLMNNEKYEIIFFCDMWNKRFEETGLFDNFVGGANLWLRKR